MGRLDRAAWTGRARAGGGAEGAGTADGGWRASVTQWEAGQLGGCGCVDGHDGGTGRRGGVVLRQVKQKLVACA